MHASSTSMLGTTLQTPELLLPLLLVLSVMDTSNAIACTKGQQLSSVTHTCVPLKTMCPGTDGVMYTWMALAGLPTHPHVDEPNRAKKTDLSQGQQMCRRRGYDVIDFGHFTTPKLGVRGCMEALLKEMMGHGYSNPIGVWTSFTYSGKHVIYRHSQNDKKDVQFDTHGTSHHDVICEARWLHANNSVYAAATPASRRIVTEPFAEEACLQYGLRLISMAWLEVHGDALVDRWLNTLALENKPMHHPYHVRSVEIDGELVHKTVKFTTEGLLYDDAESNQRAQILCVKSCGIGFLAPNTSCMCNPHTSYGEQCEKACTCLNQGRCDSEGKCSCREGFTGDKCQFSLCESNWVRKNSECQCKEGVFGEHCTEVCHCLNNGRCKQDGQCSCRRGFHGHQCQDNLKTKCLGTNQAVYTWTALAGLPCHPHLGESNCHEKTNLAHARQMCQRRGYDVPEYTAFLSRKLNVRGCMEGLLLRMMVSTYRNPITIWTSYVEQHQHLVYLQNTNGDTQTILDPHGSQHHHVVCEGKWLQVKSATYAMAQPAHQPMVTVDFAEEACQQYGLHLVTEDWVQKHGRRVLPMRWALPLSLEPHTPYHLAPTLVNGQQRHRTVTFEEDHSKPTFAHGPGDGKADIFCFNYCGGGEIEEDLSCTCDRSVYYDKHCEKPCQCLNQGQCDDNGACSCQEGFTGDYCQKLINETNIVPCNLPTVPMNITTYTPTITPNTTLVHTNKPYITPTTASAETPTDAATTTPATAPTPTTSARFISYSHPPTTTPATTVTHRTPDEESASTNSGSGDDSPVPTTTATKAHETTSENTAPTVHALTTSSITHTNTATTASSNTTTTSTETPTDAATTASATTTKSNTVFTKTPTDAATTISAAATTTTPYNTSTRTSSKHPGTTDAATTDAATTAATTDAATTDAATTAATTDAATTSVPTTAAATTTSAATTDGATTSAATTAGVTTDAATTESPTTKAVTTKAETTNATTAAVATTAAATTAAATTEAATTSVATTDALTTDALATEGATTEAATTEAVTTEAATTEAATTAPACECLNRARCNENGTCTCRKGFYGDKCQYYVKEVCNGRDHYRYFYIPLTVICSGGCDKRAGLTYGHSQCLDRGYVLADERAFMNKALDIQGCFDGMLVDMMHHGYSTPVNIWTLGWARHYIYTHSLLGGRASHKPADASKADTVCHAAWRYSRSGPLAVAALIMHHFQRETLPTAERLCYWYGLHIPTKTFLLKHEAELRPLFARTEMRRFPGPYYATSHAAQPNQPRVQNKVTFDVSTLAPKIEDDSQHPGYSSVLCVKHCGNGIVEDDKDNTCICDWGWTGPTCEEQTAVRKEFNITKNGKKIATDVEVHACNGWVYFDAEKHAVNNCTRESQHFDYSGPFSMEIYESYPIVRAAVDKLLRVAGTNKLIIYVNGLDGYGRISNHYRTFTYHSKTDRWTNRINLQATRGLVVCTTEVLTSYSDSTHTCGGEQFFVSADNYDYNSALNLCEKQNKVMLTFNSMRVLMEGNGCFSLDIVETLKAKGHGDFWISKFGDYNKYEVYEPTQATLLQDKSGEHAVICTQPNMDTCGSDDGFNPCGSHKICRSTDLATHKCHDTNATVDVVKHEHGGGLVKYTIGYELAGGDISYTDAKHAFAKCKKGNEYAHSDPFRMEEYTESPAVANTVNTLLSGISATIPVYVRSLVNPADAGSGVQRGEFRTFHLAPHPTNSLSSPVPSTGVSICTWIFKHPPKTQLLEDFVAESTHTCMGADFHVSANNFTFDAGTSYCRSQGKIMLTFNTLRLVSQNNSCFRESVIRTLRNKGQDKFWVSMVGFYDMNEAYDPVANEVHYDEGTNAVVCHRDNLDTCSTWTNRPCSSEKLCRSTSFTTQVCHDTIIQRNINKMEHGKIVKYSVIYQMLRGTLRYESPSQGIETCRLNQFSHSHTVAHPFRMEEYASYNDVYLAVNKMLQAIGVGIDVFVHTVAHTPPLNGVYRTFRYTPEGGMTNVLTKPVPKQGVVICTSLHPHAYL
ncbi:uncharacterized protein LOC135821100 [Sycon ciliatum]|uniref:uncharacterized protein LOC135821100 n=1 Tax=Sycon ciliatum TaxID=27933 RepID=UPI0031F6A14B